MPKQPRQGAAVGEVDGRLQPGAHHAGSRQAVVEPLSKRLGHERHRLQLLRRRVEGVHHPVLVATGPYRQRAGFLAAGGAVRGEALGTEPGQHPVRGQLRVRADRTDTQTLQQVRQPGHPQHADRIRREPRRIAADRDDVAAARGKCGGEDGVGDARPGRKIKFGDRGHQTVEQLRLAAPVPGRAA